jgi:hypothetical protein
LGIFNPNVRFRGLETSKPMPYCSQRVAIWQQRCMGTDLLGDLGQPVTTPLTYYYGTKLCRKFGSLLLR